MASQQPNSTPACYPGWGLYDPAQCQPGVDFPTSTPMELHGSRSICFPSPFSPYGGAREWQSNELILKDACLRSLARVAPLDCDITQLYYVNPVPKY